MREAPTRCKGSSSAISGRELRASLQRLVEACRSWLTQIEVTVRGLHYPQENSPDEVGVAIATWLKTLE